MLYCCFSEWLPVRSVLNSAELLCPAPASTETEVQQICSAADLVEVKISSRPGEKPAQLCHAADTYLVESRSSFCHCSLKVKPSPSALGPPHSSHLQCHSLPIYHTLAWELSVQITDFFYSLWFPSTTGRKMPPLGCSLEPWRRKELYHITYCLTSHHRYLSLLAHIICINKFTQCLGGRPALTTNGKKN